MTDIIDTIDGALRDWDTSDDAMRWVPEDDRQHVTPPQDDDNGFMHRLEALREDVRVRWVVPARGRLRGAPAQFQIDSPLPSRRETESWIGFDGAEPSRVMVVVADVRHQADGTFIVTPRPAE